MSMRIAKYPQLFGFGVDLHTVWPGSLPPVPPALVNPAPIPWYPWLVRISNHRGALLTGKFTLSKCSTEFIGDTLVGHDWGPGQMHIAWPPVVAPNTPVQTLASSHKYFLPCYSVQETPQGGALSLIGAGATPVAVMTPALCILVQDCWEGWVVPSGMVFQLPTTRWVGSVWSDLFAGLVLMVGDNVAAKLSGAINKKLSDKINDKLTNAIVDNLFDVNKKKQLDMLVKGQKLLDALLDDKWGLCGLVLGAANTAVGNFASARFSSDDWGVADVVGIIVATPLGAPAVSVLINDKAASAIADSS